MQSVRVRKSDISPADAADVIQRGLGERYTVRVDDGAILVRKGGTGRAKVRLRQEAGSTVFEVRGQGAGFSLILMAVNEFGIARRVAAAIGTSADTASSPAASSPAADGGTEIDRTRASSTIAAGPGRAAGPDGDAISVRGLRMSYGSYEAVRGIDFTVASGEILAFLGPNGAGKTTTTEILEGFRRRTAGEVSVLGTDPGRGGPDWRGRIGVVLQTNAPERLLSVRECLSMYAGYYREPLPVERVLGLIGLTEKADTRCDALSGGQQRRLDVGLALIGDPELIFLDEPTTGFDPSARHMAWDVIRGLRDFGKTVFLTTHFMDEAENLADRIIILAAGRIVAEGTPETIGGRQTGASVITFTLPQGMTGQDLPPLPVPVAVGHNRRVEITAPEPMPVLHALSSWAVRLGLPVSDIAVSRPTLEDIYLSLTEEPT